jgi:hypothetical protein
MGEVKNVVYQPLTNQLRDFMAYAMQQGLPADLIVRQSTRLSAPLQQAAHAGLVNVLRLLP